MTDFAAQLDELIELCRRLDLEVRKDLLGGTGGGLCSVHGRRVLFIDLDADVATRLDGCLAAFATLPEVDSIFITPALRERIDRLRQ